MHRYTLTTANPLDSSDISEILARLPVAGPATLEPARRRLEVHGRRWFQKSYGNTYHTVRVVLDGVEVYKSPKTYGYGDSYRQTAEEWLFRVGHITPEQKAQRLFLREMFDYTETVQDVARERDL